MRKNTQMNKKKCGTSDIGLIECDDHIKRVSYSLYLDEKKHKRRKKNQALRWKYDAIEATFEQHEEGAFGNMSNVWLKTYMECQICKKHVCCKTGKSMSSLSCCIDFHNDLMQGKTGKYTRIRPF